MTHSHFLNALVPVPYGVLGGEMGTLVGRATQQGCSLAPCGLYSEPGQPCPGVGALMLRVPWESGQLAFEW